MSRLGHKWLQKYSNLVLLPVLQNSSVATRMLSSSRLCPALSDPCMNAQNRQWCRMLEQTNCQKLVTIDKSCPKHFLCLDYFDCPDLTVPCMNEENAKQCRGLVESGSCQDIVILDASSCPLQFQCNDTAPPCPDIDDPCMNQDNLRQCQDFVRSGCKDRETMESCPLRFACAAAPPGL
jgi:hypothetical protein